MDALHLYHELEQLLRMNSRYCMDDGTLLKNRIVEDALSLNPLLVKLLLGNDKIKAVFFQDVEGVVVFDKVKFQRFVSDTQFLGGSYTMFKNKIGLTDENGRFISESREVVLSWPYKDCVLEGGQTKEEAKRNEVFWNETLAPDEVNRLTEPKVFSHFKRYDKDGEHEVEHLTYADNFIIKGNNLLALHSLKKKYAGKVKLIYIDPPYNTGKEFIYNDDIVDMKYSFEDQEGWDYNLTDAFVNTQNFRELNKFYSALDGQFTPDDCEGVGFTNTKTAVSEGTLYGIDKNIKPITIYKNTNPKHSTMNGGLINVNTYTQDHYPFSTTIEVWMEVGIACKHPTAILKQSI